MENYWKTKQARGIETNRSGCTDGVPLPDFLTPASNQPGGGGADLAGGMRPSSSPASSILSSSQPGGPRALSSGRD